MAKVSPTQRSLKLLREAGWECWVVEQTVRAGKLVFKRDLFNAWDLIGIRGNETIAVQTTTLGNLGARLKKLAENQFVPMCRDAGWKLEAHGWRKLKAGWQCKVEDVP
jgi:hypothetical protein